MESVLDTIADDSFEAVLQVLLLMVFADRKAQDEEIDAVCKSLPKLKIFMENEIQVPDEGMDALVIRHTARVRAMMDDNDLNEAIDRALARIKNPMLTPMVLAALHEISASDDNVHNAEINLIERAEAIWN